MKVLLDESVPIQLRRAFPNSQIATVAELGWSGISNGTLLSKAEQESFQVLVTADKNLRYQQNLSSRRIAIVELWTNHRPTLEKHFAYIENAVLAVQSTDYFELKAPVNPDSTMP